MKLLLSTFIVFLFSVLSSATTYHTVSFTGSPSSDFASDEAANTSSGGVTAYLTWDASNLYVAYAANNGEPVIIYIDVDAQNTPTSGSGTTGGFNYDGITPTLPFTANFVAYMKNGYQEYRTWTGSAWSSNTTTGISTSFGTNTEEYSIPWSTMGGKPSRIYFLMYKDNGGTYIYGQAPTQLSDGNNSSPSFSNYYSDQVTTGVSPFAGYDTPLAVEMSSYSAAYTLSGVSLTWKTQSEIDNAGFNIYRKSAADAAYSMIAGYRTIASLRGLGTSTTGKSYSYTDTKVVSGGTYTYKIEEVTTSGTTKEYGPIQVQAVSPIPTEYALRQNYPNPFNPATTIVADLKKSGYVRLEIYNSLGQKVESLYNGYLSAGVQRFTWNAAKFPSGIYFYRFTTDGFSAMNKMVLTK